jgi:hypothetical protein
MHGIKLLSAYCTVLVEVKVAFVAEFLILEIIPARIHLQKGELLA